MRKETAYWCGRLRLANRTPKNVIQLIVVDLVGFAEIHFVGSHSNGSSRRVALVQRNTRLLGRVRFAIGGCRERGGHGAGSGVEMGHGPQSYDKFNGPQHGSRV